MQYVVIASDRAWVATVSGAGTVVLQDTHPLAGPGHRHLPRLLHQPSTRATALYPLLYPAACCQYSGAMANEDVCS
jgi:hypothetical protein